ncbi:MAG: DUF3781 domain-containing protein [Treponema sp.]|nr:DUF3781 domain-containing protein [Treponema sp.]
MEDKKILLDNIAKIHTTEMGADRIRRNLGLDKTSAAADPVEYCRQKILSTNCNIYRQGKNWYCETCGIRITVNSYSYTIITAHKMK